MRVVTSTQDAWEVAGTISRAFANLPASQYLVPGDPDHRDDWMKVAQPFFAINVEHAIGYGTVYATDNYGAVATWFDGTIDSGTPENYEARRAAAVGPFEERFAALDDALGQAHPHDPHHHLAFLAVDPQLQSQGWGTALIRRHHEVLHQLGVPAYLESASPRLVEVYQGRGYQPAGEIILDGHHLFTQMWWHPTSA